jgi:hypothetical protein
LCRDQVVLLAAQGLHNEEIACARELPSRGHHGVAQAVLRAVP